MGSVNYISANTGQTVRLVIQALDSNGYPKDLDGYANFTDGYVLDGYGSIIVDNGSIIAETYSDGYYYPVVQSVMFPDLSLATGYPASMIRIGKGLYINGLTLPTGASSIGTYVVSISRIENGKFILETYAINAARPFGISSVSPI